MEEIKNTEQPEQNSEKLFTQEDVDRIIKNRLERRKEEQEKNEHTEKEYAEREAALLERERIVAMKEKRIECSKIVVRKHYPHELLDILDTSDPEDFEDKAEALSKVGFRSPYPDYVPETIHGSPKSMSSKHVPRPYGIRNWED